MEAVEEDLIMDLMMSVWLVCGLLLMLAELLLPAFVVFFFGFGALVVAGTLWLFPEMSLIGQVLLWLVTAIVSLLLFRRRMLANGSEKHGADGINEDLIGCMAEVCEAIFPPSSGRVLLRGVTWVAEANVPLAPGARVRIVDRRNITLVVTPDA